MPQKRFKLDGKGQLHGEEGGILDGVRGVDADRIEVPHLVPHVVTFDVGSKETSGLVKVLVRYSCHCWSSEWDDPPGSISGNIRILDGANERAFDSKRFNASLDLPTLIEALPETQVYVTRSVRNYGCYNASRVGKDGMAYTAYFTMRPQKGRFDGIRHTLLLQVESAYPRIQPEVGRSKTSLRAIIAASRKGGVVKYRRP